MQLAPTKVIKFESRYRFCVFSRSMVENKSKGNRATKSASTLSTRQQNGTFAKFGFATRFGKFGCVCSFFSGRSVFCMCFLRL